MMISQRIRGAETAPIVHRETILEAIVREIDGGNASWVVHPATEMIRIAFNETNRLRGSMSCEGTQCSKHGWSDGAIPCLGGGIITSGHAN